jgi:hypothetical protein
MLPEEAILGLVYACALKSTNVEIIQIAYNYWLKQKYSGGLMVWNFVTASSGLRVPGDLLQNHDGSVRLEW